MQIIKRGKKTPPNEQVYVMKCKHCGCKFTYMKDDIKCNLYYLVRYICCPQCHSALNAPTYERKYRGDNNEKENR